MPQAPVGTPMSQLPTQPSAGAGVSTPVGEGPAQTPGATAAASPESQTPRPATTETVIAPAPSPSPTPAVVASPTATAATPLPPASRIAVTEHPETGPILTDDAGRTLYLFTGDTRNISNCNDQCAVTWPPLLTSGDPTAAVPVDGTRLRMISRQDGSLQVTYNGWPLYHFSEDLRPGDTNGQNSGNAWFVVSTAGGPIQNNAAVMVSVNSELGTVLTDVSGRTVYLFTVDERNASNCSRDCAVAWPPLLTVGEPRAGEGVASHLIATIDRGDGTTQVTYNGWPLYYFAPDEKPGDVTGQNVADIWFVVSAAGGPIQTGAFVSTADHSELGTVLTDASGRTLYLFTMDMKDQSTCSGGCAQAWPPLLTVGAPTAERGASSELLGTTAREEGSIQVTYQGQPLYYFAFDEGPGEATGQNSGGVWFAVTPAGTALTPDTATAIPTATPTVVPVASPTPTANADSGDAAPVQEVATIENYRATKFFPPRMVVVHNVTVRLFVTRLHREHVNRFSIEPFLLSTEFYEPGTMGEEKLTPDRLGDFKMKNEGHGFQGDFIVVATVDEARKLASDRGVQELSIIHDLQGGSMSPSRIEVFKGILVRVYNTSLEGSDRVSIDQLYTPEEDNVKSGEITLFEFTPDTAGEFMIKYVNGGATGTLVVR